MGAEYEKGFKVKDESLCVICEKDDSPWGPCE